MLIAASPAIAHWAIPMLALTGFAIGSTGPSRDMIVRGATPPGASGRVYGFVYSGLDLGATLGASGHGRADRPRLAAYRLRRGLGVSVPGDRHRDAGAAHEVASARQARTRPIRRQRRGLYRPSVRRMSATFACIRTLRPPYCRSQYRRNR